MNSVAASKTVRLFSSINRRCIFCAKPISANSTIYSLHFNYELLLVKRYSQSTYWNSKIVLRSCSSNPVNAIDNKAAISGAKTPKSAKKKTKTTEQLRSVSKKIVSNLAKINLQNPALDIYDGITFNDVVKSKYPKAQQLLETFRNNDARKKFLNGEMTAVQLVKHLERVNSSSAASKSEFRYRVVRKLQPPEPYQPDEDEKPVSLRDDHPNLTKRPAVVTILGHVDHGKTTLLDYLRNSNIVEGEHGGITQRIGAFNVKLTNRETTAVTFIDTPGHAAFERMRERGTACTDLVILIVAADDGVMTQTEQCIQFIQKFKTPFIVAITKIDKSNAEVERAQAQLADHGVEVEQLGGQVPCVPISIHKGKTRNIDELLDTIETVCEMVNPRSDPTSRTECVVVEAKTEPKTNSKSASVIVKQGTLKTGQILVSGKAMLRSKILVDENGRTLKEVMPGKVANVIGWKQLPEPGEYVLQIESEKRAREIVQKRELYERQWMEYEKGLEASEISEREREMYTSGRLKSNMHFAAHKKTVLPSHFQALRAAKATDQHPHLDLFVRADNQGSLEALLNVLSTFKSSYCTTKVVNSGVGPLTSNEFEYAKALEHSLIVYFNVSHENSSPEEEDDVISDSVTVISEPVIYHLIDAFKERVQKVVPKVPAHVPTGEATIRQLFASAKETIAGCKVNKGVLKKLCVYRITRKGEVVAEEVSLRSMRHLKNDVGSIDAGKECGLVFEGFSDIQVGDVIVSLETEMQTPELEWDPKF